MEQAVFEQDCAAIATVRGTLLMGWGDKKEFASPPENSMPAFYFPDFFLRNKTPWLQFSQYQEFEQISFESAPISLKWIMPSIIFFEASVCDVIHRINAGEFSKAVPYTLSKTELKITSREKRHMLQSAWQYGTTFNGFTYGFWNSTEGMIGTSPEQLFTVADRLLKTIACAGTSEHPYTDEKDKIEYEHQFVVDGLINALNDYCDVKTLAPYWKQAGNTLYHLVTPIEAECNEFPPFMDLINRLHPSAAIGCYPKEQGMSWLQSYDRLVPRNRYGAPVGYRWLERQEEAAYAAIRNVQWKGNQIELCAGCGVVSTSNPEKEWIEWNNKFNSTRNTVGL